jgi:hypothetical protein
VAQVHCGLTLVAADAAQELLAAALKPSSDCRYLVCIELNSALKVMAPLSRTSSRLHRLNDRLIAELDPLVAKVKPQMVITARLSKDSTTAGFSITFRTDEQDNYACDHFSEEG